MDGRNLDGHLLELLEGRARGFDFLLTRAFFLLRQLHCIDDIGEIADDVFERVLDSFNLVNERSRG